MKKYILASLVAGVLWMAMMLAIPAFTFAKPNPSGIVGTWELKAGEIALTIVIDDKNISMAGESIPYTTRVEGDIVLVFAAPEKGKNPALPESENKVLFVLEPKGKDKIEILGVGVVPIEKSFLTRK